MPILEDSEILSKFRQFSSEFVMSKQYWRDNEIYDNYAMDANDQWTESDWKKYEADGIPQITINVSSPILDAVAGFEIENRNQAEYSGRLMQSDNNPQLQQKADSFSETIDNGVQWMEGESFAAMETSEGFRDMLVCGLGASADDISYSHDDSGLPTCRRVFPGFVLYDAAARRKNLSDTNSVAEAKPVDRRTLEVDYGDVFTKGQSAVGFDDVTFLQYFNALQAQIPLTIIYEFQWRIKEDRIRVENPFFDYINQPHIMAYAATAEKEYNFTLDDGIIGFDPSDYRKFKKDCGALEIPLSTPVKQKKYRYYRALLGGGVVLEKGECMSQNGFSIKFMTGKYDEINQCFYGMMRPMKDPQRALNRGTSDLQGFINTSPQGGVFIESDAVTDIKAFIRTYRKGKYVTILSKGGLQKIEQKQTAPIPSGLAEIIQMMQTAVLTTVGMTPEFMGEMQSKDMTSDLQDKIVQQVLSVLATYFDAKKRHTIERGRLLIDKLKILAENNPGRLIPVADKKAYMQLFADNMSIDYDITIADVPVSRSAKQKLFDKLMDAASKAPQLLPLAMKFAPIDKSEEDMVNQLLMPPPPQQPPPPDPLNQALIQSTISLNQANAAKSQASAAQMNVDNLNKVRIAQLDLDQRGADVDDTKADTLLKLHQAAATVADMENMQSDTMSNIASIHKTAADIGQTNSQSFLNHANAHIALNPPVPPVPSISQ